MMAVSAHPGLGFNLFRAEWAGSNVVRFRNGEDDVS